MFFLLISTFLKECLSKCSKHFKLITAWGQLKPFSTLQAEFQLHTSHFLKYAQLQHAWGAEGIEDTELPEYAPLEGRILQEELTTKAVSVIYKTINNNMPDTLGKLRGTWEGDLGEMEDIDWEAALMHPREVVIKARLRLIQFKTSIRATTIEKNCIKMGCAESPRCLCCRAALCNFLNMVWACPHIGAGDN